jgi:hypothetical protein
MPTLTLEYHDEAERLLLEQAIAFCTQLRQVAHTAPAGTVLAACEKVALEDGRRLLRTSLAAAVQSRVEDAEKKGAKPDSPAAQPPTPASPKDGTPARS